MVRRVFRIYPLSILIVAAMLLTNIPSMNVGDTITNSPLSSVDVVSNFLLTQNLTYSASIPGQLWSLPYEIQMYCFLPALFLIARFARLRVMLAIWLGAVVLALTYGYVPLTGRFNVLDYAPCFIPGVIAYSQRHRIKNIAAYVWPVTVLGVVALYLFAPKTFPYKWAMCLTVGLLIPSFMELKNRIVNSVSHWIAKYSYGIYLGHLACMWLAFVKLNWLPMSIQYVIALSLTAGLSYLLFHSVESPMIKIGSRLSLLTLPGVRTYPRLKSEEVSVN